jgi:hypothetical protein
MAVITVKIDLGPKVTAREILQAHQDHADGKDCGDWFERGKILVDDAYLTRAPEDDSFFEFELVDATD